MPLDKAPPTQAAKPPRAHARMHGTHRSLLCQTCQGMRLWHLALAPCATMTEGWLVPPVPRGRRAPCRPAGTAPSPVVECVCNKNIPARIERHAIWIGELQG